MLAGKSAGHDDAAAMIMGDPMTASINLSHMNAEFHHGRPIRIKGSRSERLRPDAVRMF
jgi:hypothetical protein